MAARRGAPRGAGRPAAGGLTLGQASGGRPAPIRQGLGLGLGLNPRQRGAFTQAAQGGSGVNWMTSHPNVMRRLGNLNPTGQRATNVQNFIGTGQSQRGNLPRPPTRGQAPGARGMMRQPQMRPMGGLLPQNHPLQPYMGQVNPGMQSVLASRGNQMPTPAGGWTGGDSGFGGGGMPGWTGDGAAQQPGLASQQAAGGGAMGNYNGGQPYGGASGYGNPSLGSRTQLGGMQMNVPAGYGGSAGGYGMAPPMSGGGMGGYFAGGGMYGGGQLPQGSYRSGGSYLTGYGQGGGGGWSPMQSNPMRTMYGGGAGGFGMAPPMSGGGQNPYLRPNATGGGMSIQGSPGQVDQSGRPRPGIDQGGYAGAWAGQTPM